MEFRRMNSVVGSRPFRDDSPVARKLLAAAAPTPSYVNSYTCRDVKSGAAVACQNPHTLVIIVAGMACMVFLVAIALLLLCWSVVRQRRIERERRESGETNLANQTSSSSTTEATAAVLPVDSPEFNDAVLVQLPGDEKPQFFALPKPFLADGLPEPDTDKNANEFTITATEEKEPSSEDPNSRDTDSQHDDPSNPVVENACVPSADGLFHNPLFCATVAICD